MFFSLKRAFFAKGHPSLLCFVALPKGRNAWQEQTTWFPGVVLTRLLPQPRIQVMISM